MFSWWALAALPIPEETKREFLVSTDLEERLALAHQLWREISK